MIKVTKGTNTKIVTRGAYESFYKPLGYYIVNDNNNEQGTQIIEDKEDKKGSALEDNSESKDDSALEDDSESKEDKEDKKSQKFTNIKKR